MKKLEPAKKANGSESRLQACGSSEVDLAAANGSIGSIRREQLILFSSVDRLETAANCALTRVLGEQGGSPDG